MSRISRPTTRTKLFAKEYNDCTRCIAVDIYINKINKNPHIHKFKYLLLLVFGNHRVKQTHTYSYCSLQEARTVWCSHLIHSLPGNRKRWGSIPRCRLCHSVCTLNRFCHSWHHSRGLRSCLLHMKLTKHINVIIIIE